MRPKLIHALEEVEEIRPFLGKYTIRLAPDGAAVMDGSDCIAVYYFGESLVVDKAYRRQGIGEELVYQWRKQYPAKAKADTRTRASQALQEKVWDRLIRE
jgi:GNAT superfamily N-acetyltransferase